MVKIIAQTEQKELKVGSNGFWEIRNELDNFVYDNFDFLYEGAVRLNCNISEDYYAPDRVQIGNTRLHRRKGLKYADGHKYSYAQAPTEEQLKQTVEDLNKLIKAATQEIPKPFVVILPSLEKDSEDKY